MPADAIEDDQTDDEVVVTDDPSPEVDSTDSLTPDESTVATGTDATGGADTATDDAAPAMDDEWRRPYEELGFQDLETPAQAQQRLIESFKQERQRAEYAQQQAQYHQSLVARLGQPDSTPTASQPAQPQDETPQSVFGKFASSWVDVDREAIAEYLDRDDDGNPTWKPNTPPEVISQVHQAQATQRKWNDIVQDPRQLATAIEQQIESLVGDRLNKALSERESLSAEEQSERQFIAENEWLYAVDPITNRRTNQPSAEGRVFGAHFSRAKELGIPTRSAQIEYAMAMFRSSQQAAAPVAQRPTAQAAATQQRNAMLGRTNGRPATPTTSAGLSDGPANAPTGASRMSFAEAATNALMENKLM